MPLTTVVSFRMSGLGTVPDGCLNLWRLGSLKGSCYHPPSMVVQSGSQQKKGDQQESHGDL